MGIIKLTNIRTFSYHGCLDEEAKIGSNYRVDLNRIVVEEMAIRAKLLEHVAQRIIDRVLKELLPVLKIKIEVTKLNPPIGGDVEGVTIRMKKKR